MVERSIGHSGSVSRAMSDRTIAFNRCYVEITGSVTAALMLSQACYWSRIARQSDGWFYKTADEWTQETGLSRREQETAREKMRESGIVTEKKQGIPCQLFYRVDFEMLAEVMACSDKLEWRKAPNSDGENRQAGRAESAKLSSIALEDTERRGAEDFSLPAADLSREVQAKADALTFPCAPGDWAEQFIAAYPKKTAPNDVEAALEVEIVNLRKRHGWDDQRCVDHLLAKAAEYAASKFVATCPRKEMPSPAPWLKAGRYREDPAEWDTDMSGARPRTPAKPKVQKFDDGRKAADTKLGSEIERLVMQ